MPVLALVVAEGGRVNAHRIAKAALYRGGVLGCSQTQVHRTLQKLADGGYLRETQGELTPTKRFVKVFIVTDKGLEALGEWLETPSSLPMLDTTEAIPRIRVADELGARRVLRGLSNLRQVLDDEGLEIRRRERDARKSGPLDLSVELEGELGRELLGAYARWLDRATERLEQVAEAETKSHAEFQQGLDDEEQSKVDNFLARVRQDQGRDDDGT